MTAKTQKYYLVLGFSFSIFTRHHLAALKWRFKRWSFKTYKYMVRTVHMTIYKAKMSLISKWVQMMAEPGPCMSCGSSYRLAKSSYAYFTKDDYWGSVLEGTPISRIHFDGVKYRACVQSCSEWVEVSSDIPFLYALEPSQIASMCYHTIDKPNKNSHLPKGKTCVVYLSGQEVAVLQAIDMHSMQNAVKTAIRSIRIS